ncbi:hypothetical protein SGPA1_20749 [Streptomyces misionensis JCM 4497]
MRTRHDRGGHRPGGDRDGGGHGTGDRGTPGHARRAGRGPGRGPRRPSRAGHPAQRGVVRARTGRHGEGAGRRGRALRHGLRRQLLRHRRTRPAGAAVRPGAQGGDPRRRSRRHAGGERAQPAGAPGGPAHLRLQARAVPGPGLHRPALPQRHGHPPGLVRPLAVRHRHLGPDGPAERAGPTAPAHRVRERVVHRHPVHRPAGGRREGGRTGRRGTGVLRPGVDHRHGELPARPERSLPARIRALGRRTAPDPAP